MTEAPWGDRVRAGWEKVPRYLLYILLGYIIYLGLNVALLSKGVLPDYDGLSYVTHAMKVNLGLSGAGKDYFSHSWNGRLTWVGLPFTNTLDVLFLALLFNLVDYHVAIWLIHTAYLLLFVHFARQILSPATTLVLFIWAVSHTLFLHQYTNFVSEMKVGMLLALFVAFLFREGDGGNRKYLFWITILLLLARTINLLFIGPLVVTYLALRWPLKEKRLQAISALKPVVLAILVLSPLLAYELWYLIAYIQHVGQSSAGNWRDMTGVYGKADLFYSYLAGIKSYNVHLAGASLAALVGGIALDFTSARSRLVTARDYAVGAAVAFAVLMQAQTNNIMVVFWVFILLGLCVAALLSALLSEGQLTLVGCLAVPIAIWTNYGNFIRINQQLADGRAVSEMARSLSGVAADVDTPIICANFHGLGPLDGPGLELSSNRKLYSPSIDVTSYGTPLSSYIGAYQNCNVAFVANWNFMWPGFVGINRHTEALRQFLEQNAGRIGMAKVSRFNFDSDPSRYIEAYARPTLRVNLKYVRYNDNWLDAETSVVVHTPGAPRALDGYTIELRVMVPSVDDALFKLPIKATLFSASGQPVAAAVIDRPGDQTMSFPLDAQMPGAFRLVFDKTFAPKDDPRKLAALYSDATLKFRMDEPLRRQP